MLFSRQEYWSGLPRPPLGYLPNPGFEPTSLLSPAFVGGFFTDNTTWEALLPGYLSLNNRLFIFEEKITANKPVCVRKGQQCHCFSWEKVSWESGSQSGSTPALRSGVPLGDPNHGQQKEQEHQPHVVKPSQTQIETVPSLLAWGQKDRMLASGFLVMTVLGISVSQGTPLQWAGSSTCGGLVLFSNILSLLSGASPDLSPVLHLLFPEPYSVLFLEEE